MRISRLWRKKDYHFLWKIHTQYFVRFEKTSMDAFSVLQNGSRIFRERHRYANKDTPCIFENIRFLSLEFSFPKYHHLHLHVNDNFYCNIRSCFVLHGYSYVMGAKSLSFIGVGTFRPLPSLQTIYIKQATSLSNLPDGIFNRPSTLKVMWVSSYISNVAKIMFVFPNYEEVTSVSYAIYVIFVVYNIVLPTILFFHLAESNNPPWSPYRPSILSAIQGRFSTLCEYRISHYT